MKNVLWIILLFLGAVLLAFGVQHNSGSVIFVLSQHRIELSFNFFVVLLLLALFVLFLLFRILAAIFNIPKTLRRFQDKRAQEMFNRALLAFFEGQHQQAFKLAQKTYQKNKWKGLSALLAAHCAENENQRTWLNYARQADESLHHAATLLEAQTAFQTQRFGDALNALSSLPPKIAASKTALLLDLSAREGLNEGQNILSRLKMLQKKGVLTSESAQKVKNQATLNALKEASDNLENLTTFLNGWKPENINEIQAAVDYLLHFGDEKSAQKWIEKYLSHNENLNHCALLFARYASLKEGDEKLRIAQAEKWLNHAPDNSALLLALGQMCLKAHLWGKAQNYLEAAIALNHNLEAHLELARLLDYLNRPEDANKHYRALAQTEFKEIHNVAQNL